MLNYYFLYLVIQLSNFMKYSALYSLLPSLFDLIDHIPNSGIWKFVIKYCWKEFLDRLKKDYQLPTEYQIGSLPKLPNNIQIKECLEMDTQTTTKYAIGTLDGYLWKFKFEE